MLTKTCRRCGQEFMTTATLWDCILGVNREIDKRKSVLHNMRYYLKNPGTSGAQYSMGYIYSNGPRLLHEIWRLKVIKTELFYQYNLKLLFENNKLISQNYSQS